MNRIENEWKHNHSLWKRPETDDVDTISFLVK